MKSDFRESEAVEDAFFDSIAHDRGGCIAVLDLQSKAEALWLTDAAAAAHELCCFAAVAGGESGAACITRAICRARVKHHEREACQGRGDARAAASDGTHAIVIAHFLLPLTTETARASRLYKRVRLATERDSVSGRSSFGLRPARDR